MDFRRSIYAILVFGLLVLLAPADARAQASAIAQVKTLSGTAILIRGGTPMPLAIGDDLFVADVLRTEAESALGISFTDHTAVSLGSNSELELTIFEFDPGHDKLAFLTRLLQGTLLYVSGIIAKLSPEDVRIETPVASVAVRGTRMLVRAK